MRPSTLGRNQEIVILWLRGYAPKWIAWKFHVTVSCVYMVLRRAIERGKEEGE